MTMKKILSICLTIAMLMSTCSVAVNATDAYDTVSDTDTTVFGNSSFTWSHNFTKTSDDAYDGTYTILMNGGATITATKTFYVEETNEYALNVYGASSVTNEWASDMKFVIDEEVADTFTKSNSTVEPLASPLESGVYLSKNIKYGSNILLEEGVHTITFTIPQVSSYGQRQTLANFTFDCAKLTPSDTIQRVNTFMATTIGNSLFTWNAENIKTSANAYDGTYTIFEGAGIPITGVTKFYVEEEGEYTLSVRGASSITNEYLSDMQFAIDEESAVILKSNNSTVAETDAPCVETGAFAVKDIKYGTKILLQEGFHTITFTIPNKTIASNAALFVFDCMTFMPVQSLDGVELAKSSYVINVGGNVLPELINGEGKNVVFEQFDSIQIEFSEPSIAYTVGNAKIIASNKGYTSFKVTASANGESYEFDGKLYVTDNQGLYITDAVLSTNQITLNVASTTDYSGEDKLIFAVFGQENGCPTSLKAVYTQDIPEIGAEKDTEITQAISVLGEDEFVRVFILNKENSNRSLYGKTTLGLEAEE